MFLTQRRVELPTCMPLKIRRSSVQFDHSGGLTIKVSCAVIPSLSLSSVLINPNQINNLARHFGAYGTSCVSIR